MPVSAVASALAGLDTGSHYLFGSFMDDSTRAAYTHANLVRLAGKEKEQHLFLVRTESSLRDQTLHDSMKDHVVSLRNAEFEVKAYYLDGPLIQETEARGWPVASFAGKVEPRWVSETGTWSHNVRLLNGFVVIDSVKLRGLGLGTYLLAQVVLWAKRVAPQGDVQPILLSVHQAKETEARDRRNRFYERFGLTFDYRAVNGIESAEGSSLPIKVSDLRVLEEFSWLEVLPLEEFLQGHFKDLRVERARVVGEVQRYERVVAAYIALHRETNWIVGLGRWIHRVCYQDRG